MVKKILLALGSGYIGSLGNILGVWGLNALSGTMVFDKLFVYKQLAWGSLWAILYCINFFNNTWWIKGIVVSVIASAFTFFVFRSIPFTGTYLFRAITVNVLLWGTISSYLYHKSLSKE